MARTPYGQCSAVVPSVQCPSGCSDEVEDTYLFYMNANVVIIVDHEELQKSGDSQVKFSSRYTILPSGSQTGCR